MFSLLNTRSRLATLAHVGVFLLAFVGMSANVANGAAVATARTVKVRVDLSAASNITSRQTGTPPERTTTSGLSDGSSSLTLGDLTCGEVGSGTACLPSIQQAAAALILQMASQCYDCESGDTGIIYGSANDNTNGVIASGYYLIIDTAFWQTFVSTGQNTYYDGAGESYALYLGAQIADSINDYNAVMLCVEFFTYDVSPVFWMGMAFGWNYDAYSISDSFAGEIYNTCGYAFGYAI